MSETPEWKQKVQEILGQVQDEVKKTTQIGVRMLNASKTNSCLNRSYEELGEVIYQMIKEEKLSLDDKKISNMVERIDICLSELQQIEKEVGDIKANKSEE